MNFYVPDKWEQLYQEELLEVYKILVDKSSENQWVQAIAVLEFLLGASIKTCGRVYAQLKFKAEIQETGKTKTCKYNMYFQDLAELLDVVSFIFLPGSHPVRLEQWHGTQAVNAELHGLSFGEYLQLENCYQGYLSSRKRGALEPMARILYPGIKIKHIDAVMEFNVLQWMVQIKNLFASKFRHLFQPSSGSVPSSSMLEVMNNQIRALTGGDVTKEDVVFETDCWRALTELDYKAKEADDYKRRMKKIN